MARAVALKLQSHAALAVLVRMSGRGIVVESLVPIPLAEGDDAASAGKTIAAALAPFSPGRLPTVAAIARGDLHWGNYDLPPAPADELPQLVQLQAQRDFPLADDGLGFDFISLHGDSEHPHRVLSVGLPPAQFQRVREVCAAADLRLQRIVPEAFGWVELGRRVSGGDADALTVYAAIAGRQAAVWAMQGDALRMVRTVYLAPEPHDEDDLAALGGELKRTLLALAQMAVAPTATLPCIYCGEHADRIAARLTAALGRPVRGARLSELVEAPAADLSEIAPLAALAAAVASDRPSHIDLLHPRRPPAPPSRRRLYLLAAAAAACVALGVGYTAWQRLARPLTEAAEHDAQRAVLAPILERLKTEEAKAAEIDAWLAQSVNLLAELEFLGQQLRPKPLADAEFNAGEDLVVTKLDLQGKRLTISASARTPEAIQAIERRLRSGSYRVVRGVVESQGEGGTPGYSTKISEVLERLPATPTTGPAGSAAAASPATSTSAPEAAS